MKKGDFIGYNKDGERLYFIGYSTMTYNGKPLLLCHTDREANPNYCGHYTQNYFTK